MTPKINKISPTKNNNENLKSDVLVLKKKISHSRTGISKIKY